MPLGKKAEELIPAEAIKKKMEAEEVLKLYSEDEGVLLQVKAEFEVARTFIEPKREEGRKRLKLYNNQKREKDKIGVPSLYTTHNTLLSAFYFDKLQVIFDPRGGEEDIDICEALNDTAKFDYTEMEMEDVEYDWLWDALFFGKGFVEMTEWDKDKLIPIPQVIDPLNFYHDPNATKIQDARFWGSEILITKLEMEENKNFKNSDKLGEIRATGDLKTTQQKRKEAQGLTDIDITKPEYENKQYNLLKWFTLIEGKKSLVICDLSFNYIFRGPEILVFKDDKWPIIEKAFSPMSHEMWGVSVADLAEDKQRAQAILANLAIAGIKTGLYPTRLFDQNMVDKYELENFQFNKFIPVKGNPAGVVANLPQELPINAFVVAYDLLDRWLQQSTATPEIKRGMVQRQPTTLGETQMATMGTEGRQSLPAKLFGNAEKRFWRMWYGRYKQFFPKTKEKTIRIRGAIGFAFKNFTRKDLIAGTDPDVIIESSLVSEYKKVMERRDLSGILQFILQSSPEMSGKRYTVKKLLRLYDWTRDEIELALPPTIDELQAEEENEKLADNKMLPVEPNQDHYTHLVIHARVEETNAKMAHCQGHKMMVMKARERPELFHLPQLPSAGQPEKAEATGREMFPIK